MAICEPVVGAQSTTAEILKEATAKLIAASACLHEHLRAWCATNLRRISARQNLELLDRVNCKEAVGRAQGRETRQRTCSRLAQTISASGYTDIRTDAIDNEVVCAGALAIDAELSLLGKGRPSNRHSWR